jgi:hypothetical protein
MPDFTLNYQGTISLLLPISDAAKEWVEEHLPEDRQYFGKAVVIEHRYVDDIVNGIINDGLEVGGA